MLKPGVHANSLSLGLTSVTPVCAFSKFPRLDPVPVPAADKRLNKCVAEIRERVQKMYVRAHIHRCVHVHSQKKIDWHAHIPHKHIYNIYTFSPSPAPSLILSSFDHEPGMGSLVTHPLNLSPTHPPTHSLTHSRYPDVVHVGVAYLGLFRVCTVSQFVLQNAIDGASELRKDLESDLAATHSNGYVLQVAPTSYLICTPENTSVFAH